MEPSGIEAQSGSGRSSSQARSSSDCVSSNKVIVNKRGFLIVLWMYRCRNMAETHYIMKASNSKAWKS